MEVIVTDKMSDLFMPSRFITRLLGLVPSVSGRCLILISVVVGVKRTRKASP
jgi:hypothetical protein